MSRQQKRAGQRAEKKAVRPKKTAARAGIVEGCPTGGPLTTPYDDLNDRQRRGYELWVESHHASGTAAELSPSRTYWSGKKGGSYAVTRDEENRRGTWVIAYGCGCKDHEKNGGRLDCKHIFADKLRRGEVVVVDAPAKKQRKAKLVAQRRPARQRFAHDGTTIRTAQRRARMAMPARIPDLLESLKGAYDKNARGVLVPLRRGPKPAPLSTRAIALIAKVANGESCDGMMHEYERMIREGTLLMRRAPSRNTMSAWINDERLTPVLRELLRLTSFPFREREIGCIIDSSQVSQLMTAHSKEVHYGNHDERPNADWMKAHALVGVETMVVMAVEFSGIYGATHDNKFIRPLVEAATSTFRLDFLLGDKAYMAESIFDWLADIGIKAVIPIKKKAYEHGSFSEAVTNHIEWFERNNNRDFHEVYRLRSKIECLFSILKRMADGYCWSRGRPRQTANANEPCTAWVNEVLCKFIYMNLRTTVTLEHESGVSIDYLVPSRRFPAPDEPLLKNAA